MARSSLETDEKGGESETCQHKSAPVERSTVLNLVIRYEEQGEEEADDANGKVQVKDPAPGKLIGQPSTQNRTQRRGDHDGEGEHGRGLGSLRWRERAEEHGGTDRREHAATNTLENASGDKHLHRRGCSGDCGGDGEHTNGEREGVA